MLTGLVTALILVAGSPNVFNPEPGAAILVGEPLFALTNPAIISISAGFISGWIGTLVAGIYDKKKFTEVIVQANTGVKYK